MSCNAPGLVKVSRNSDGVIDVYMVEVGVGFARERGKWLVLLVWPRARATIV